MKKINYLMFVSLLMAFAFGVTPCNKDKDDDVDLSKAIIGIWDYTSHETYIDGKTAREFYIEFFSNNEADLNGDGIINEQDKFDIDAFLGYEDADEAYLEFKADGSAISYAKYQDGDEDNMNVKYEISGNKLILTYEGDEDEGDEDGDVEEYEISIKGKTLTMKYEYEWTFYFDQKKHTRRVINTLTKR